MIWDSGILLSPGAAVGKERIWKGKRVWDPRHSKYAALCHIIKHDALELCSDMRVLYLGAGNGTTVSYVADYVEVVYGVEPAPEPMSDLVALATRRRNIIPLLSDANQPDQYAGLVEQVDMVYQDVAQPNQVDIFLKNCSLFLHSSGVGILMLKTRSIDVRRNPEDVCAEVVHALSLSGLVVIEIVWLDPWHRDHSAIICLMQ
jgi:fibrillarin-like pre-rRNA processing protein